MTNVQRALYSLCESALNARVQISLPGAAPANFEGRC